MAVDIELICRFGKPEYFFKKGWTGRGAAHEVICPSGWSLRQRAGQVERSDTHQLQVRISCRPGLEPEPRRRTACWESRCSKAFAQQFLPVVMGPGSEAGTTPEGSSLRSLQ
jgi:hypothetical protein